MTSPLPTPLKRPAQRPTKRTTATLKRITQALDLGATRALAAAASGISYETLRAWCADDPRVARACEQAEAAGAQRALEVVKAAAAKGDWAAAAWLLERRHGYVRTGVDGLVAGGGLTLRIEWTRDWRQIGAGVEQQLVVTPIADSADGDNEERDALESDHQTNQTPKNARVYEGRDPAARLLQALNGRG